MLSQQEEHNKPLQGLPDTVNIDGIEMTFGPYLPARRAAEAYCRSVGITLPFPKVYQKLNISRAKQVAQLYDEMKHMPDDPVVISSYKALCDETWAQWQFIKRTGLHVEFSPMEQPYANPRKAILDISENNHFYVNSTRGAFSSDEQGSALALEQDDPNPLLVLTDEIISGQAALLNDIFRIVHDFFGHAKEGLGFRAAGEDNAWRGHATMYSPLARRALATELRGQNSWVNYGPYGASNRKAGMDDTVFAPQKLGLLPEWVAWEGAADEVVQPSAVSLISCSEKVV
ncbi:hypothetical protein HBI81_247910 [Parastagonospora nodorum]|nr:hypothetical protein HBH42_220670 [Parastagonospora nodorum]KAH4402090.1 hypothetical protein HBH92_214410 [Parastagonospora nodorum]KAH4434426.1 hypothetical protein HBH93_121460 [Parastagonospora nodorum]KAH4446484.1 hypothetical protein HBH91_146110 [Parastagonospora nodorum]KAH4504238.1 hypothetical protein HBH89_094890 [Parastagonospora nodorum]